MTVRPLLVGLRQVKSFIADRGDLAFSIALPLALIVLMVGAFSEGERFNGTATVVDRDGGPYARALIERLDAVPGLGVRLVSVSSAEERIHRSQILLYTEIPEGFSERLAAGQPAEVVIHRRGAGGQTGQIVAGFVQEAAGRTGQGVRVRQDTERFLTAAGVTVPPERVQAAVDRAVAQAGENPPVRMTRETTKAPLDLAAILFPNLAGMFVLFAVTLNAQALVQERRQGTLERLLTTRLTRNELFIGLFLGNVFRGFVQLLVLFVVGAVAFDFFTVRSFFASLAFGVPLIMAASALGLALAAIGRTPEQALWGAVVITNLMAVFGGTFTQLEEGSLLWRVAHVTINYWSNTGFERIIQNGAGLSAISGSLLVLSAVTVAGIALARFRFRPVAGGA